jgi:hypothetical protein
MLGWSIQLRIRHIWHLKNHGSRPIPRQSTSPHHQRAQVSTVDTRRLARQGQQAQLGQNQYANEVVLRGGADRRNGASQGTDFKVSLCPTALDSMARSHGAYRKPYESLVIRLAADSRANL